jgi:enamine deaminase RidA (YjgF/YER057c/UK114 family)
MSHRAIYPPGLDAEAIPLRLSPAVLSDGHLFLTGMTGAASDGTISADPETQFRATFDKIAGVLAAAGADWNAVVEMTSYHLDIDRHFDAFERAQATYVRPPYPAWTAVEVAGLRRPGALVEVRVIARAPDPFKPETPR